MAFTAEMLRDKLDEEIESGKMPGNAVVMLEIGDYVRAAEAIQLIHTEEFPVLALTSRKDEIVN